MCTGSCWLGGRIILSGKVCLLTILILYSGILSTVRNLHWTHRAHSQTSSLLVFLISVNGFISCPVPQGRIKPEWLFFLPNHFFSLQVLLVLFLHPSLIRPFLPVSTDATKPTGIAFLDYCKETETVLPTHIWCCPLWVSSSCCKNGEISKMWAWPCHSLTWITALSGMTSASVLSLFCCPPTRYIFNLSSTPFLLALQCCYTLASSVLYIMFPLPGTVPSPALITYFRSQSRGSFYGKPF